MNLPTTTTLIAWIAENYELNTIPKKLAGEVDLNYYLKADNGSAYLLKIAAEDSDLKNLEMQGAMLQYLEAFAPHIALPRLIKNKAGEYIGTFPMEGKEPRYVRLLSWVPGKLWAHTNPHSPKLLKSLGRICGEFSAALKGFDHSAAHRWFKWDNKQAAWTEKDIPLMQDSLRREKANYFLNLFKEKVLPVQEELPQSIIHNDANDYNTLIDPDKNEVSALIDFGDAIYSYTINELSNAIAYAVMGKADPIRAALPVITGYHEVFPLTETELEVLFPLICTRLLISATCSARNRHEFPDNEYLLISEAPAWDLLDKFYSLSPEYVYYRFREACGWVPCPMESHFTKWASTENFASLFTIDLLNSSKHILDLGVGSLELGNNHEFDQTATFDRKIKRILEDAGTELGIGKYDEIRPVYTTDAYEVQSNEGPIWRTLHLGIDVFLPPETAIHAPLAGTIHSFQNNDQARDYGPTIILEHNPTKDVRFYSLYGHLSLDSLEGLQVGQEIPKGKAFAKIGAIEHNGNWPPHLHFQLMLDMLGKSGDFPGVAFPNERKLFLSLCPDPQSITGILYQKEKKRAAAELLAVRKDRLGKNLSLSYQKPLHMERAYLQYLYDTDGRRYLDTVNNVPHVGHQHPRVVRAAQKQAAVLNTNTRYLHDQIVAFAEELCETFPDPLSVAFFVNSGSEANELALRMARTYTAQKDMLVLDVGYHGNTQACIEISSYKFDSYGGKGAADFVHKNPIPDGYRGLYRYSESEIGQQYAAHIGQTIQKLQAEGKGFAAFIHESILSCGGQIVLPPNYLKEAYRMVREAGGLCIADEVQVGFGRVGDQFWGFELQGVVPDIVTMGKPIGNGHPLGAVVCRPEIAEAFANGMEYFNTFGGNPVSCAIGREVLAIVKEENLQAHAKETGDFLKSGLSELQKKYPIIGDVRGHGFFLGFELVKNLESLVPADEAASYLANRMCEKGILMSVDGPFHNVIKIKPPMAFQRRHATFLLETLEQVFQEDFLNKYY